MRELAVAGPPLLDAIDGPHFDALVEAARGERVVELVLGRLRRLAAGDGVVGWHVAGVGRQALTCVGLARLPFGSGNPGSGPEPDDGSAVDEPSVPEAAA